ncbi:MAG: tyrosine-protein kinase family protein [Candidatus Anammoxibacter sp.]
MSKIEEALKKSKIDLKDKAEEAAKFSEDKKSEKGGDKIQNEKRDDSPDDCLTIKRDDANVKDSKFNKWDSHITTAVEKKGGGITTSEGLLGSHDDYNTVSLDRVDAALPIKETEGKEGKRDDVIPCAKIENYDVDERIVAYYESIGKYIWEGPVMVYFRRLRLSLNKIQKDESCKVFLFASAKPEEGKSVVALNTAITLCSSSDKNVNVAIVDCDLRRPSISRLIGFCPEKGLSDYLARDAEINDVTFGGLIQGLTIIPAGNIQSNTCELLGSVRMEQFLAHMRSTYDYVIMDSPPVLAFPDTQILALESDGVIFVIDCKDSRKSQVKQAIDSLHDCKIVGCVMNKSEVQGTDKYKYGYGRSS